MKLRQLMITKKIDVRNNTLVDLMIREEGFKEQEEKIKVELEEIKNEEDEAKIVEKLDKLEKEKEELEKEKKELQEEIDELEKELEVIEGKEPENRSKKSKVKARGQYKEGESRMKVNKFETRSQILERLNIQEVRDFYTNVVERSKSKRSVAGGDLLIPTEVVDLIQLRVRSYSRLYDEVTVQALSGDARAIIDGALPEAIWTEACDEVKEMAEAFEAIELDQYKVGGFIPVCNAVMEDSLINLANYLEERIARAIASAVDKAILVGEGSGERQPEGIIPAVNGTDNEVTSNGNVVDIIQNIGLVGGEDGEDEDLDEVIAVMNRRTYYQYIVSNIFVLTEDGRVVVQGSNERKLPDGTRIVLNRFTPSKTIVVGDFKKYLLGERSGIKLTSSEHVRFIQDQTVFKGTARYDGKPVSEDSFVVIKIEDGE